MKKRFLSLLLCACMVLMLLPALAITASAAGTGAITLGTSGISGYNSTHGYNYIYYGLNGGASIKWRVLDAHKANTGADGMFLLSEDLLGTGTYGGVYFEDTFPYTNAWQGSVAQSWCDSFETTNLTAQELSAIIATAKSDGEYKSKIRDITYPASDGILSGDKVFFLSAEEAETAAYGFVSAGSRIANYNGSAWWWWLRSPSSHDDGDRAGFVYVDGVVSIDLVYDDTLAARPALNLDLNSVLFAFAAEDGKSSGAVGAGALNPVLTTTPAAWKLTLLDSTRAFTASLNAGSSATVSPGSDIAVDYSGAKTGAAEYVSAMLADSDGNIVYYGNIASNSASGTNVPVTIPSGIKGGSYTLKLFSEQCNGNYKTDYASAFVNLSLTVPKSASPTTDNATVIKTSATKALLAFTLTNSPAYADNQTWKVYAAAAGDTLANGITASNTGNTLTLAHAADIPAGNYYVSVTEAGKAESDRLALTAADTHGISLDPAGDKDFGTAAAGYAAQTPYSVTVKSTGTGATGDLTVALSGANPGSFALSATSIASIAAGGSNSFTVVPKTALAEGTFTVTVTVSNTANSISESFNASFAVTAKSFSDGGGSSTAYYTITATAGTGGTVSPGGSASVASDSDKTYTITANEGYELKDVLVDGVSVGAVSTYTFENVKKAHTIAASFKKIETDDAETEASNPFTDVKADDWFYENVLYVNKSGLMTGTGSDKFNPYGTITRSMAVMVLFRLSGDKGSYTNTFSDVPYGEWYENAAAWAAAKGITSGAGDNTFSPNAAVTREQLAVILYNYAKYTGYNVSVGEDTNILSYNDALTISEYAYPALQWACGAGIIGGDTSGNLNPQSSATRAELAAILQRFCKM